MTVQDLLARLVAALEAAEIPYMLTGSYASSLHSIPRATRDLDIVIFPNREQLTRFARSLPADRYYCDLDDAIESLRRRTIEVDGLRLSVVSPEDIVIAKLLWAKAGQSERQIEDAAAVIRVRGSEFDVAYVEKWVRKLAIEAQWQAAKSRAH